MTFSKQCQHVNLRSHSVEDIVGNGTRNVMTGYCPTHGISSLYKNGCHRICPSSSNHLGPCYSPFKRWNVTALLPLNVSRLVTYSTTKMCDFWGQDVGSGCRSPELLCHGLTSLRPPCCKEAQSSLLGEMLGLSSKERDAWPALICLAPVNDHYRRFL